MEFFFHFFRFYFIFHTVGPKGGGGEGGQTALIIITNAKDFVINTNIKYLILDTASNEVVMMNRRRPGPNICQMACGPDDCIFTAECYCNCCKMYCPGDEGYEPPPQWAPGPRQNPNINININGK